MSRIVRELIEAVGLAIVVFLLIQTSIQNFKVEGSSMDPTLEDGQYLLVNKLVYFRLDTERLSRIIPFWDVEKREEKYAVHSPERGEVIVFEYPRDPRRDFVKRVIGLPGEEVEIQNGEVYVDGTPLDEPYITHPDHSSMDTILLEEGEYFVLGDNRRSSNDSRSWGPVPQENILGKVWFVYWPVSNWNILNNVTSWAQGAFD